MNEENDEVIMKMN